jgi:hypothetical protein
VSVDQPLRRASGSRRVATVALAIALGSGCGLAPAPQPAIRVDAEQFPWADVSRYHTYQWWSPPLEQSRRGFDEREALLDWHVRQAVDRDLAARGYAPAGAGKADFIVSYDVALRDASTQSFQDYLQYRADGGRKDMGEAFIGYTRGTLTLEFQDATTRRVAWRATASAIVEDDARGKRIDPAVQQMLDRFPAAR